VCGQWKKEKKLLVDSYPQLEGGLLLREKEQQTYGWEERLSYAAICFSTNK
jgi:hypothetical protein